MSYLLPIEIDAKINPSAMTVQIPYYPWKYQPRLAIHPDGYLFILFEKIELRRVKYFDGKKVVSRWVLDEWPDGIPETESIFAILKKVGML